MYQTLRLAGVIGGLGDRSRNLLHAGGRFHNRCRLFIRTLGQILITGSDITTGATQHHRTGLNFLHDMLNILNRLVIGTVQG